MVLPVGGNRYMFSNNMINKAFQRVSRSIIISSLVLALGVGLFGYSVVHFISEKRNMEHLNDIIVADYDDKTGRIAYGDFVGFFQFAVYGDDLGYYIAYDEDFIYIISLKDKDYDYYADLFDQSDDYVRFYGRTIAIPSEAKSYAIESLNEEMGYEFVDYSSFDDIFGDVCLAVGKPSDVLGIGGYFDMMAPYFVFALMFVAGGLIGLLVSLKQKKSFDIFNDNGMLENDIVKEMNSEDCIVYDKSRLCLTEHYLINLAQDAKVIRYSDIFWTYIIRHRTNLIPDYNYLNVMTSDGRQISCANSPTFGKKKKEATEEFHNEILRTLAEKNENIRIGYVKENIDAYREHLKARENSI